MLTAAEILGNKKEAPPERELLLELMEAGFSMSGIAKQVQCGKRQICSLSNSTESFKRRKHILRRIAELHKRCMKAGLINPEVR